MASSDLEEKQAGLHTEHAPSDVPADPFFTQKPHETAHDAAERGHLATDMYVFISLLS